MVGSGVPDRDVVAVINYKGGVGKTTLTANLGADLARRGKTVLVIDLDPQASLTFSLYDPPLWERELADERTILQWFGSVLGSGPAEPLSKFVLTPPAVNAAIAREGTGRLDLVASHLGLVDVDLDFAHALGGSRFQHGSPRYLELHRSLTEALADEQFDEYDLVLIDCAPNFTMVTRTGIVASDWLLVPAKPDYISTLGIDFLRKKLSELVHEYNRVAPPGDLRISPQILGIVFTMVQYGSGGPINVARNYLRLGEQIEVPVFQQSVRENKTTFGNAGQEGIPAVLSPTANAMVQYELQQLTVELLARIRV
jgi:chromosome partitioning protein